MSMKNLGIIVAILIVVLLLVGGYRYYEGGSDNQLEQNINITTQTKMNINEGITAEILNEGIGTEAKPGDVVAVNYTGMLEDGTVFDSNVLPEFGHVTPFEFSLGVGQVIQGWDLGVAGMKVGEKRKLTIEAPYAYGDYSPTPAIPAGSTLVFEVELLGIK